ncbi:MAG: hypothetical protein QOI73_515 [Solirubrobacteraceae bacterium]|jgi:hypothetical protein|nr:hypothetical protein [Solirubrobacteraceae bacterium]
MGYKILGFAVWQGARWYARKRINRLVPSRKVAAAVLVGTTVVAAAAFASTRASASSRDD